MRKTTISLALLLAAAATACFSERVSAPDDATPCSGTCAVAVSDNFFTPATRRVAVGSTVVWSYDGASAHNVTSNTGAWTQSPTLMDGAAFEHTFEDAGEFDYECTFHPGMSGTVVVE